MSTASSATCSSGEFRGSLRSWRPLEIAAAVAGLIIFWPVGVAFIAWKAVGYPSISEMRAEFERKFGMKFGGCSRRGRHSGMRDPGCRPTGNAAFEEYRQRELSRLEEERRKLDEESRQFAEFVEELKRAKDREEFDAYMRRRDQGQQPATA